MSDKINLNELRDKYEQAWKHGTPSGYIDDMDIDTLHALVEIAEAAKPMANLPSPATTDEHVDWLTHQKHLRDALTKVTA